jgi:hypothetical protein
MAGITKQSLSGAAQGIPVVVPNGVTNITTLHSSTSDGNTLDEIWLWASGINYSSFTAYTLTVQIGSQSLTPQIFGSTLPQLVIPGWILAGTGSAANTVKIYANGANVILVTGYVNRIVQ